MKGVGFFRELGDFGRLVEKALGAVRGKSVGRLGFLEGGTRKFIMSNF